ncbi:MAG: endonuclease NucS [Candidatus Caldarchaeum sp.]|nr:endonuclease NucS [Candidatus Caldarchaeum sp.]MDW7977361.1 endonuclease NucS [Candidatus Caldarchaeum sp.]MDW8359433.1 endonuclease NucS [Candidatus Caldarchaeum sp.]
MPAVEEARKALAKGEVIVMAGPCEVVYEGRGASRLGEGERLVIIKRDRSILVHRPTGHEPVNWQPSGSAIEFKKEEGLTVVTATNGDEVLRIRFTKEPSLTLFKLSDEALFEMYASEEEMKMALLAEPSLIEEGFTPMEDERYVREAGRVDVLGVDREGRLVAVELKRRTATRDDVKQLMNYLDVLEREFGKRPRGILAAPSATKTARAEMAGSKIEFKCLTPKKCMQVIRKKKGLDAYL